MTYNLKKQFEGKKIWQFIECPNKHRYNELLGGGFAKGSTHLVYAGTGVGKTSFTVDLAVSLLLETNLKVCILSLEETFEEVQSRIASRLLSDGKPENRRTFSQILKSNEKMVQDETAPFWEAWQDRLELVNTSTTENIGEIDIVNNEIGKRIYDFNVFFIDHIHLIYENGNSNDNSVSSKIATVLKKLSNQGACIVANCQMRKNSDSNKEPTDTGVRGMDSIAGSSRLINAASTVTHLYRTARQQEIKEAAIERGRYEDIEMMLRVEKSRLGRNGYCNFSQDPRFCSFRELPYNSNLIGSLHKPLDK